MKRAFILEKVRVNRAFKGKLIYDKNLKSYLTKTK